METLPHHLHKRPTRRHSRAPARHNQSVHGHARHDLRTKPDPQHADENVPAGSVARQTARVLCLLPVANRGVAFLMVVAAWALYVAAVHARAREGRPRVIAPMRDSNLPAFSRATVLVVWHATTLFLVHPGRGRRHGGVCSPRPWPLLALALLQACRVRGSFSLRVGTRELGEAVRLPQWLLFGPLAFSLASSFTPHPAAIAGAGMLLTLGIAHLAWATGSAWPARDQAQLATYTMPADLAARLGGKLPSRAATVTVAVSLFTMALSVLGPVFGSSHRWPALAVAGVLAARGAFGLAYAPWSPLVSRQPFALYNRIMFSPGCLFLATIIAVGAT